MHYSERWIVKYDNDNLVREVKLIYSPDEYRKCKRPRPLNTQEGLIKILQRKKITKKILSLAIIQEKNMATQLERL